MQEHPPNMEQEIGEVTHFWRKIGVAGVHLDAPLDVGDHIHVLGRTSDFEQDVGSIQLDHTNIQHADAGLDVGVRIAEYAREHDKVYKVVGGGSVGEGQTDL